MADSEWIIDKGSAESRIKKNRYSKMKRANEETRERSPKIWKQNKDKFQWKKSIWEEDSLEEESYF